MRPKSPHPIRKLPIPVQFGDGSAPEEPDQGEPNLPAQAPQQDQDATQPGPEPEAPLSPSAAEVQRQLSEAATALEALRARMDRLERQTEALSSPLHSLRGALAMSMIPGPVGQA